MKRLSLCVLILAVAAGCASVDRPLQLLAGAAALYPAEAKAQGVEGSVEVAYGVTADGRVINARVVQAQPPDIFDEAALAAVRQWRFNSPIVDGKPQAVEQIRSTIRFRLSGAERYQEFD